MTRPEGPSADRTDGRLLSPGFGLRMPFGMFLAPFHPVAENPELRQRRDFELVEWLDPLGYDDAWIGEHHSAGNAINAEIQKHVSEQREKAKPAEEGAA